MWDPLKRLQSARESVREASARLSPLYGAIESASAYLELALTLEQLNEAIRETHTAFAALYDEEDANPEANDALLDLVDSSLHCLDRYLENPGDAQVRPMLEELQALDLQLQHFDLAGVYVRLQLQREERELLAEVATEIPEAELELGYLGQLVEQLDQILHHQADPTPTLSYLEELHASTSERQRIYNETPLAGSEWTLEVALADRCMLRGYELWLGALEGLHQGLQGEVDEPALLTYLEWLREGNRNWILVERLAGQA